MKSAIVFSSIVAIALSSCSSVYRTAQTPDDIYYSPGREATDSYVQMDRPNERAGRYRNDEAGQDEYMNPDDRVLRMRVRNRGMWSAFDDYGYGGLGYGGLSYSGLGYSGLGYGGYSGFGYGGMGYSGLGFGLGYGNSFGYSPYGYGLGLGYGMGSYYNNYYGWNNLYNPYYGSGVIIDKTRSYPNTRVRSFNPNTYSNRTYNTTNATGSATRPNSYRPSPQNGTNNTNTLGTSIRRVFGTGTNNSNSNSSRGSYYTPNNDRPVRSYNPPSNNSSSSPVIRTQSSGSTGGGSTGGGSTGGGGGTTGGRPGRN